MSQSLVDLFNTSVQEAVQATIQQNKPLFVFLAQGEADEADGISKEFLHKFVDDDDNIISLLGQQFVLLKLLKGSTEYMFFNQIFKDLIVPSFYIVQQGKVLAIINDSNSKDHFLEIITSLAASEAADSTSSQQHLPQPPQSAPQQQPESTSRTESPSAQQSHPVTSRAEASSMETKPTSSHERDVQKHKEQVARLRKEQREERNRLRALLDADRKELLLRSQEQQRLLHSNDDSEQEQLLPKTKQVSEEGICVLSIKLFDGSSIKQEFNATDKLSDVRTWLDEEIQIIPSDSSMPSFARNSHHPSNYAFHRPMLPRITFTKEQELSSLEELELTPRSALILKPIYYESDDDGASEAGVEKPGIFGRVFGAVGKLGGILYSFFDYGVDSTEYHPLNNPASDASSRVENDDEPINLPIADTRPLLSLDNRSSSLLNIEHPVPNEFSRSDSPLIADPNISSAFNSRSSTPRPSSRMRIQTLHDADGIDTYNGNSVNLNERPDKDEK
ncbi:uncharacterized protein J8A68_002248 [[Candida] subhashii]|uniref:UBX domain-containing protein n=1 Tax=[Candida] subhashii TaxID=561895 RepID=A0A8J5V197_9ASCO|nr:uncharacterized protein J8A68_002248 [[Candida] subhashii]KAG7664234.1 hypothetical protein J8A68_002248 [[Candida] subhashii]